MKINRFFYRNNSIRLGLGLEKGFGALAKSPSNYVQGVLEFLRTNPALIGVILLSLGLNFYSIGYGLPYPAPHVWLADQYDEEMTASKTEHIELDTLLDKSAQERKRRTVERLEAISIDRIISPVGPLAAAKDRFSWGRWSRRNYTYPLAHYMILGALYSPFVAYLAVTGGLEADPTPGYPYGLSDPVASLTVLELIARSVTALMATGIVICSYFITKEMFGKRAGIFSALIVAVCYLIIFYAHVPTIDLPYIFWFMLAFYCFVRLIKSGQQRYYILFGVFVAVSFATKDQVYALLPLLGVGVLWFHYRQETADELFNFLNFIKSLFHKKLVYAALGFLITFIVMNNLIFNFPRAILHYSQVVGIKSQDRYLDPSVPYDHYLLFRQTLYFLRYSMGLPLLLICIMGLFYSLYSSFRDLVILFLPVISYYLLFIVMSAFYVHARHVLPIAIILTFYGGKVLADFTTFQRIPQFLRYAVLAPVIIFAILHGV